MKAKTVKLFLMIMIMKWQSTPQLSWQREFRRRQLLKIFYIYKIMKRREKQKNHRRCFLNDISDETCTSLRLSNKKDTARVTINLPVPLPSCSFTNDNNDCYPDLENRSPLSPSSASELSAATSSSRRKRHSNNSDEVKRAILEALHTNIQPSLIDGFMLRLAKGMRRLPYKERSQLELDFLMKLHETETRLGLLNN